jgi:hypothetical protein
MRKLMYALLISLLCSAATLASQAATPLLPDHFASWQATGPAQIRYVKDMRGDWSDWSNARDVLREAGLERVEDRSYSNGSEEWPLRVLVFVDPSSAYEAYSAGLTPGMTPIELGDESARGQNDASLLIGNFVVNLRIYGNPDDLKEIVAALKAKADKQPFPPLKNYLPTKWRVFGSEKYALGPQGFRAAMKSLGQGEYADLAREVGFESGVEAIFAKYQGEHGSGILLLLEYPTPQLAEQHLRHLEQALPAAAKQAGVTVERKTSLLSLVFAPTSPMHAQAIRDEVNYETQVTWNESSHTATDPPLVLIMVKIFLFTGLFLGIATAVGVAFGGLRVIIKRLFPGKVFDRPQDIEVLQLGLSGKKIDPTDMY